MSVDKHGISDTAKARALHADTIPEGMTEDEFNKEIKFFLGHGYWSNGIYRVASDEPIKRDPPPDLDEAFRNLQKNLDEMFGSKPPPPPKSNSALFGMLMICGLCVGMIGLAFLAAALGII